MQYVGIDLGSKSSQLCVKLAENKFFEQRISTTRDSLIRYFGQGEPKKVLVEASTGSEWVARTLEELGHEVIIGDPNFELMYATRSRRIKTDRRDARALCEACELGLYRSVIRRSDEGRLRQQQLAVREAIVSARTKMINVCRALLRAEGIKPQSGAAESFVRRVEELELSAVLSQTVKPLLAVIRELSGQIAVCTEQLKEEARVDEVVTRLMSVPGVGVVTALAFEAVIDTVERFGSAKQVRAYLGLVPAERSSGERRKLGHLTKTGNSRVRHLLVEAGWNILCRESAASRELRKWGLAVAGRRGRKVAAVALARKLAGIMYAIWRDGTDYQSQGKKLTEPAWG